MRLFLIFLLILPILSFSQDTAGIRSIKIHSIILNEDRFFQVYLPPVSNKNPDVIYVLDGQAQFRNVVNALKQLGQPKIVIGIGNIWLRDRDYTPTHVSPSRFVDSNAARISGGGEKFNSHLEKELIPFVESNYGVGKRRILIGHSLGGLTAMNLLLKHNSLFHQFIIIDPSMWWDDCNLLKQTNELLKNVSGQIDLFLAIANTANKDKNHIEAIRSDTTISTAQTRPSVILLDYLKAVSKKIIKIEWKYYKDENHISVFQPAVLDGLRFLLYQN